MVPLVVRRHCLAEGLMLSWGIASVVIFCVSVSLLNKLLPHNVSVCQQSLYCVRHWVLGSSIYLHGLLWCKIRMCMFINVMQWLAFLLIDTVKLYVFSLGKRFGETSNYSNFTASSCTNVTANFIIHCGLKCYHYHIQLFLQDIKLVIELQDDKQVFIHNCFILYIFF